MSRLAQFFMISLIAVLLIACRSSIKPEQFPPSVQIGAEYYTQVVMRHSKGSHITTNYQMGELIPINSKVILKKITRNAIVVERLPDLKRLTVKNVIKHTKDDVFQAFEKLFGKYPVDMSNFDLFEINHIDTGSVAKGMGKDAVLLALGYPPQIQTLSLDADKWTYWSARHKRFFVYFVNDKVERIEK